MAETDKPRESIKSKDVTERAAAARDLARTGGWDDLGLLVDLAVNEKSPSVRLYAAAAAANILHRIRIEQGELDRSQQAQVMSWVAPVDPGNNPGILSLLAVVPEQKTLDRLTRMMRDLRNEVREGAVLALARMATSATAPQPERFERMANQVLSHSKRKADVMVMLIRLAGDLGWHGVAAEFDAYAPVDRQLPEVIEAARERFAARENPESWAGLWISDGRDAGLEGEPGDLDPIVIDGDRLHDVAGPRPFSVEGGVGEADGYGTVRMIWTREIGADEVGPALQAGGRTYFKKEDKDLAEAADELGELLRGDAARSVAQQLTEVEGAVAKRVRPVLLWRAGDNEAAYEQLTDLTSGKKARNDLFWWLGRVAADLGKKKEAKKALKAFLDKAGKKAVFRTEAEALLSEL